MYALDLTLLRFLNRTISWGVLDQVMATVTEPRNWAPIILLFVAWICWRRGWRGAVIVLGAAVVVAVTDASVHRLLKPLFSRIRPCNALEWVVTPAGKSFGLSFPSAHATNAFALATFFSVHFRRLTPLLMAVATLVALSRVYLGLHYPSDVAAGAILGAGVALLAVRYVPPFRNSPSPCRATRTLQEGPPADRTSPKS
jgi:undecaprenyl-diphosphatase